MAEQYQLPGEFRAPDLSAAIAAGGNQNARDQEAANNFIRQYDATTNITNANRMQSLRERQLAQEMINADRNFQLQKDQQENNFQVSNRDFDLKKEYQQAQLRNFDVNVAQAQFAFDREKTDYNNMVTAYSRRKEWNDELVNKLGPSGAYNPDAESIMADFALEKGTNPGFNKVITEIINDHKGSALAYQQNSLNKTIADTRKEIGSPEFKSLKFTDPNLPSDVGEVGGTFILAQLQQARAEGRINDVMLYQSMLNGSLADIAVEKQARIQEKATLRASRYGLPAEQIDVKGGEISTRFGVPKTVRGSGTGTGGTGGGLKPTEDIAKGVQSFEVQRDLKEEAYKKADEALQNIDKNSAAYAVKSAERDKKYSEYQTAQAIVENNARQLAGQQNVVTGNQLPSGTQAPAGTQGPRQVSDYLPTGDNKKSTAPVPKKAPDLTTPLLSPQAQRLEQIRGIGQVATVPLNMMNRFAKAVTGTETERTTQEQQPAGQIMSQALGASKELAVMRQLKDKAQKAAFARIDSGEISQENQDKAYNEELQKLISEYTAKSNPTISVR